MGQKANRTALVTGANSGIGFEACVKLARMGFNVVMVARNEAKGSAALEQVRQRTGSKGGEASLLLCDFASQAAIRKLASDYRASHTRLDVLVNNAGSVSRTRQVTADGLEQTFAVNHLGYFLLTNLLLDLLEESAPARVVNVSSVGHRHGDMDMTNLQYEHGGYWIMRAYFRSKLANVMFTHELARRLEGKRVFVNSLHPGTVATGIWAHAPWYALPLLAIAKLFMVTPEQGGDRIVYLASSPDVEGKTGGYYENDRLVAPSRLARDDALARKLWLVSAELVNIKGA